jgi:hypothetical protein
MPFGRRQGLRGCSPSLTAGLLREGTGVGDGSLTLARLNRATMAKQWGKKSDFVHTGGEKAGPER